MQLNEDLIKKNLVEQNYITQEDLKKAEEFAKEYKTSFSDYLFSENLLSEDLYGQAIAEHLGVKYVNLKKQKIDEDVLLLIPELVAKTKKVIAFERSEKGVKVAMNDPQDIETLGLIEKRVHQNVIPYFTTIEQLEEAFTIYKGSLKEEFKGVLRKLKNEELSREEKDSMIITVLDLLLRYAHQNKASDIHIDAHVKKAVVRYRIDGILHDVLELPKNLYEYILTRIKILSKMRTDEHRAAQDGKMRFETSEGKIDVRVSVVPVTQGETTVMRLLSARSRKFSLVDLGLQERDLKKVKRAIKHPHGMVLVTGPTGSGKTTTLYAVLKIVNKREINIATIEDPVEYDIEGVSQIQVNTKTNLTFAKGLRSIVRQDPDIIMVGEIRDEETAGIAVNSALTGHLVLSTLHTNDAATTLPRLLDMEVEPFLVASTVNVVIAQRLVRKICTKCRASVKLSAEQKKFIKSHEVVKKMMQGRKGKKVSDITLYHGAGCPVCSGTGYTGRVGIFEILEMDDEIRELVLKRASSDEITELAKKKGMSTMLEDGMDKVFKGITTIEEVLRMASDD
ncbi:MAG: hypothetical protein GF349_03570 [Candidatus Magasanikbacteria bacterium]|nr:hypothetical protein [Candidatus Magasanikbacteria bacterium]